MSGNKKVSEAVVNYLEENQLGFATIHDGNLSKAINFDNKLIVVECGNVCTVMVDGGIYETKSGLFDILVTYVSDNPLSS